MRRGLKLFILIRLYELWIGDEKKCRACRRSGVTFENRKWKANLDRVCGIVKAGRAEARRLHDLTGLRGMRTLY